LRSCGVLAGEGVWIDVCRHFGLVFVFECVCVDFVICRMSVTCVLRIISRRLEIFLLIYSL
jgi:hypothetical protein